MYKRFEVKSRVKAELGPALGLKGMGQGTTVAAGHRPAS